MIYTNDVIKKNSNRKLKRKKIMQIIVWFFIICMFILLLYIYYNKYIKKSSDISIMNFKFYTVISGSMEPEFNIGDLIVSQKKNQADIKVNDVISFSLDGRNTITHRVIEIVNKNGETLYKTKGDNNNSEDSDLVRYEQIQGMVVFKINKLGKIITEFVSGIGMIILLILFILSYLHSSKSEERRIAREDARKKYNIPKYEEEKTI